MEIAHNRPPRTKQELHHISISIILLSGILFFNSLSTTYFYSFLPDMIYRFNLSTNHATAVASALFFGRLLSSYLWGFVIDKYGRRPALLISLGSTCILTVLLGYSATYPQVLAIRFLTGFANGLSIIGKVLATEMVPDDLKAWSISITDTVWALGMTLGPVFGSAFHNQNQDNPVLTASIFVAIFGFFLLCLAYSRLKETLTSETAYQELQENEIQQVRRPVDESVGFFSGRQLCYILKSPNTVRLICIFSVNTFFTAAFSDFVPYWIAKPYKMGGLGFAYRDFLMKFQNLIGFQLVSQMFLYPIIQERLSDFWLLRASHWAFIPVFLFMPYAREFDSDAISAQINWLTLWNLVRNFASFFVFCALQRFINDAVSTQKRGRLNGLSVLFASLLQLVGPFTTAILAWSLNNGLSYPFDYHFAFLMVCAITIVLLVIIYGLRFVDAERRRLRSEGDP